MILVTGGTGLVGSHLLHLLLKEDKAVRAIKRTNSDLNPVKNVFQSYNAAALFDKIEWVTADVLDTPTLEDAFINITYVYHCAALVSFAEADYQQLLKVNIEGTANVVNLCIANDIKKLCHVSSVAALGKPLVGTVISEETHWNPEANNNAYAISKFGAEMEVWRGSQEGLDIIIIQPSVIIGEGHWKSASGKLFTTIKKGIPKFPRGSTGFVDVQDISQALFLLMQSDIKNKSFVLSGFNLTYQEIISEIAEQIQAKKPKSSVANWQLFILAFFQNIASIFTGKKPNLNKSNIHSLQNISEYNGSKITTYIPFNYTQKEATIKRVSTAFNAK
ncbi:nucleoside-diphosphate-sugar epimerase [unidentified eubacterium SCB49]|nr:nucleoside-diphosphate-sugar epimerase [unidentified eubacterium SCB49]